MKHKMTLGPCEVCPDCDGHKRVVCSCAPRNVGAALLRALDEAPEEPVHIEAIARAAEMEG